MIARAEYTCVRLGLGCIIASKGGELLTDGNKGHKSNEGEETPGHSERVSAQTK